ncbi:GNAT family N-acetyltransferase [Kaistella antarctica]|uniref:GNAT family N-acetyltransferase n=1 Tax=Kaistella antarctica TaxID=266748 RepID=A0A448NRJ8_9FLAO|nr:GNAT family N-acetyltransferase [Kaistella antarctica]KEY18787.1 hypothetical protein HY04_09955 [Kaistella antarctica]SEW15418.1 Acetyltransferase (GNAT) domain-containing protein [Kaistella antarctica]VEH99507.1 Uncharacterised protein [Kaistella antarctica]
MYNIFNISKETAPLFKSCFDANGSSKSIEKIIWQFLETPSKKQLVDIAIDKETEKVAAVYAVFPVHFQIDRKKVLACQSLDTMTDVDYRGKGLFVKLAADVYQKAHSDGLKLVYGFPNGSSIHGFVKKLSWQVLDPVPFLIKPLKTKYFTDKIKMLSWLPNISLSRSYGLGKNYIIKNEKVFPAAVDEIWNNFSKDIKVAVHRDKAYLDWRYLNKPSEDYMIDHIYSGNKYIGYIVYCIKEKHGGKVAYIMELVYQLEFEDAASFLLKNALNIIRKSGADCILVWCLEHSPNYKIFSKRGFFTMPEKFKPIELHFGVRAFDESLAHMINDRKNWYLSYSDSDTV